MSTENTTPAPSDTIFDKYLAHLILLIVATFILTAWVHHQFQNFGAVIIALNLFPILSGIFALFMNVASKKEDFIIKKGFRKFVLFFLKPGVLFILYLIIFLVGNFISTVTVFGDGTAEKIDFGIAPVGMKISTSGHLDSSNPNKSSIHLTNPFGKSFDIEATGYLRESFELYPWVGKKIRISEDLRPAPSLYVRLDATPPEFENGRFIVLSDKDTLGTVGICANCGALLLGKEKSVPLIWKDRWGELLDEETAENPGLKATIFNGWNKYVHKDLSGIKPGDVIEIHFYNGASLLTGSIQVRITDEAFQDYLISIK